MSDSTNSNPQPVDQVAVEYEHSSNLPLVLQQLNLSVLISTYQAGKLVVVGSYQDKPSFSFHTFDQVMGVAVARDQIAIGSRRNTPAWPIAAAVVSEATDAPTSTP